MEFRQIRYALAVARERSFSHAATRLNVSQSAVSEQVKLLEARIGFSLFRRTGRGVEVTDAGRAYLVEAQRVISDLMGLDDVARRIKGPDQLTLTIGLGSGMAAMVIPALFATPAPGKLRPRLNIRTAPTRVVFDELFEERLDAAFAVIADQDRTPSGLTAERLAEVEMVLAVPKGHRLARLAQPVDLACAFEEPLIMSELGVGYGQIVTEMFERLGLRPYLLSVVDNIETQLAIVRAGAGVAFVPPSAAELDIAHATVEIVPVTPAPQFVLGFYRRRRPLSRPKEEQLKRLPDAVRQWLTTKAGTLPCIAADVGSGPGASSAI